MGGFEGEAEALYKAAGHPDPGDTFTLAERLLGAGCLVVAHAASLPGRGVLLRRDQQWVIKLRARLTEAEQRFVVGHELSHWALGDNASEDDCDALAAALVVPRNIFQRAMRTCGTSLQELAHDLEITQSLAALRIGEVTGEPVALVTPQRVRARGAEWCWPDRERLWRMARAPVDSVRVQTLTDEPRRVAIFAESF